MARSLSIELTRFRFISFFEKRFDFPLDSLCITTIVLVKYNLHKFVVHQSIVFAAPLEQ